MSGYDKSSLIQDFILYAEGKQVEVRASVDWQEKLTMLKLKFPVNVTSPRSFYSIPFGNIEREPNGDENPGGPYIAVQGASGAGQQAGLLLLNDCKYSFDVEKNVLSMTILRSPVFAEHLPYVLQPGIEYPYMDQGRHEFRYALIPFSGAWMPAEAEFSANLFNMPFSAYQDYRHKGSLPAEYSFCSVSAPNVIVTALKRHEDSDNYIIRFHEADGKKTDASIAFPGLGKVWKGSLNPYEIKTVLVPKGKKEFVELDMIEWDAWKANR